MIFWAILSELQFTIVTIPLIDNEWFSINTLVEFAFVL